MQARADNAFTARRVASAATRRAVNHKAAAPRPRADALAVDNGAVRGPYGRTITADGQGP